MEVRSTIVSKIVSLMCYLGAFLCFGGGLQLFLSTTSRGLPTAFPGLTSNMLIGGSLIFLSISLFLESTYFFLDPHNLFKSLV